MTTRERAAHLTEAARRFPHLLGEINASDLLDVVRWELGHADVLDDFQTYAGHQAKALAPRTILHIVSGNTPHAGLQSVLRGLLLGSHNLCKIPSGGLPEIQRLRDALTPTLAASVEITPELPPDWLARAEAVVVFGHDDT